MLCLLHMINYIYVTVSQAATAALVNTSSSASSLPSGSALTGWAAFTKTSASASSGTKPGLAKPLPSSATSKPIGLFALGTKAQTGSGNGGNGGNGNVAAQLKPPPPLTLGKPALSRSSSGENPGKSGSSSPGASGSSGTGGNGATGGSNGGSNVGNGSSVSSSNSNTTNNQKASADGKAPTSQESQLNAMKRLQMVKKKAAQRKLKK